MTGPYNRRTLLRTVGITVAGTIAGCRGDSSTSSNTDEASDDTASPEPTSADTHAESNDAPSIDEFLSQTDNYDGITDETGTGSVTVDVGVEANGAYYGFNPAAIRIDSGTTVTWEWTGQGGVHNVEARHGADFESEQKSSTGETYTQTLEEPEMVLYVCVPHEGVGMKGAIVVE
ncbi:halocyanin domain-containing protein [Haloarcula sebkhae]|uniref:Halocyanin domain-containing protein n=1 Tax=Haloarcula sebkhae TaxID=932660 RepID=A0ACC6VR49_9EURY|nr:halocyanin domain-containing protein [Haloarcula sebkhae]